jgi:ATP diphosphatase
MSRFDVDDLIQLMSCLRDPNHGCPWDREQTFETIVPFTLEEAYEVADAVERGSWDELQGELGDLLFQVIFCARLAEEDGRFDFNAIVHGIATKLLIRHPHVFPDGNLASFGRLEESSVSEIKRRWEARKAEERASRGQYALFDDVPLVLPSLSRAQKIQKRAARIGFDWSDIGGVFEKIDEEIAELQEARKSGDLDSVMEEFGDLLFTMASLARHLDLDSEKSLRQATQKFESRIAGVVQLAENQGIDLITANADEKHNLWCAVKQAQKK